MPQLATNALGGNLWPRHESVHALDAEPFWCRACSAEVTKALPSVADHVATCIAPVAQVNAHVPYVIATVNFIKARTDIRDQPLMGGAGVNFLPRDGQRAGISAARADQHDGEDQGGGSLGRRTATSSRK